MKNLLFILGITGILSMSMVPNSAQAQSCITSSRSELICIGDSVQIVTNRTGAYGSFGQVIQFQQNRYGSFWVVVRYNHPRGYLATDSFETYDLQPQTRNPGYPAEIKLGDQVRVISDSYGARNWVGRVASIRPDYRGIAVYEIEFSNPNGYPALYNFYGNELEKVNSTPPAYPDRLAIGQTVRILTDRTGAYGVTGKITSIRHSRNSRGQEWYSYAVQYRRQDNGLITTVFERNEITPIR